MAPYAANAPLFSRARSCHRPGAMKPRTHLKADPSLCGSPLELAPGGASVALETNARMVVDDQGLVHGGFVFGLSDFAAMLAVNDPNVVLGAAESRFLKPVQLGDRVVATAWTVTREGRKHEVEVEAKVGGEKVFEGRFRCFVLERHVLDKTGSHE